MLLAKDERLRKLQRQSKFWDTRKVTKHSTIITRAIRHETIDGKNSRRWIVSRIKSKMGV